MIIATLVLQGLSLPGVIRLLGLEDDGLAEKEEAKARIKAAEAALERLEELTGEEWVNDDTVERLRGAYGFRLRRFAARFDGDDDGSVERALAELPATPGGAARGRAAGCARSSPGGPDQRRGDA